MASKQMALYQLKYWEDYIGTKLNELIAKMDTEIEPIIHDALLKLFAEKYPEAYVEFVAVLEKAKKYNVAFRKLEKMSEGLSYDQLSAALRPFGRTLFSYPYNFNGGREIAMTQQGTTQDLLTVLNLTRKQVLSKALPIPMLNQYGALVEAKETLTHKLMLMQSPTEISEWAKALGEKLGFSI